MPEQQQPLRMYIESDLEKNYHGISFAAHNSEERLYLEEHILATLVPGLQHLLLALEKQQQNTGGQGLNPPVFINPLNFLAMYLMRNNPRHHPETLNHPYARLLFEHVKSVKPGVEAEKARRAAEEQRIREQLAADEARRMREDAQYREKRERELREEAERRERRAEEERIQKRKEEEAAERRRREEHERLLQEQNHRKLEQQRKEQEERDKEAMEKEAEKQRLRRERLIEDMLLRIGADCQSVTNWYELEDLYRKVANCVHEVFPNSNVEIGDVAPTVSDDGKQQQVKYVFQRQISSKRRDKKELDPQYMIIRNKNTNDALNKRSQLQIDRSAASIFVSATFSDLAQQAAGVLTLDIPAFPTAAAAATAGGGGGGIPTTTLVAPEEQEFIKKVADLLRKAYTNIQVHDSILKVREAAEDALSVQSVLNRGLQEVVSLLLNSNRSPNAASKDSNAGASRSLRKAAHVCVSELSPDGEQFTVVSEFFSDGDSVSATPSTRSSLVGKSLTRALHAHNISFDAIDLDRVLFVEDASNSEYSLDITDGETTITETFDNLSNASVLVVPLKSDNGDVIGVIHVAVEASGEQEGPSITQEQIEHVQKVTTELAAAVEKVENQERIKAIADQAMDWIKAQTGANGAYFAFLEGDKIKYVSASSGNEGIIGKVLKRGEEGGAVTFDVVDSGEPAWIKSIKGEGKKMQFFTSDGDEVGMKDIRGDGSFIAAPVRDSNNTVIGILAADTFGSKKKQRFTDTDMKTILRTASLLTDSVEIIKKGKFTKKRFNNKRRKRSSSAKSTPSPAPVVQEQDNDDDELLAIEKDTKGSGAIFTHFYKKLLMQVREELRTLDTTSIAEIVNYKSPPPVIHKVLKSVLYILGYKKSQIKTWQQCRALLKDGLLKKMEGYDPTAVQKKLKFLNAKRLVKEFESEDVLKMGSYPAMLMFEWVKVAFQLRDESVALRRAKQVSGEFDTYHLKTRAERQQLVLGASEVVEEDGSDDDEDDDASDDEP